MKNKEFSIIRPHTFGEFTYCFAPIPTIILNGRTIGVLDRAVSIQVGWLCFGLYFKFEYTNKSKARKMAKEWEAEARLAELRGEE